MIRKSYIAPTKLIKEFGNKGDFHLALSHLLSDDPQQINEYEKELRDSGLPIILDNGLFENGVPEEITSLVGKARRIGATHVFAPDVLYNRSATEANLDAMARELEGSGIKMAAVVQADNVDDYLAGYQYLVEREDVALIGLSILSIPKSFKEKTGTDDITENRRVCLKMLRDLPKHKDSHLLGAGSSYRDVFLANAMCPFVVSHDSSSAIWNAIQGKTIDPRSLEVFEGKSEVPVDFDWNGEVSDEIRSRIEHNIDVIDRICK